MIFNRGTVLDGRPVEPGEDAQVPEHLVRVFLQQGRASLAPQEPELGPAPPLTSASMGHDHPAEAPKKGGRR